MCGIVAVFNYTHNGLIHDDVKILHQLWKASTVRGSDGAGLFWVADYHSSSALVNKKDDIYTNWLKIVGTPFDVYQTKEFAEREYELAQGRFLVGHNRAKTTGKLITDHAHPFEAEHILMVHNGTLNYIEGKDDFRKFETDSMALADDLSKRPAEVVLGSLNGGTAVVWYNSKEKTMNVYRNSGRPLAFNRNFNRWWIASEASMLRWVLSRNELTAAPEKQTLDIQWFKTDVWYKFTHNDATPVETVIKPVVKPIPFFPEVVLPRVRAKHTPPVLLRNQNAANDGTRKSVPAKKFFGLKVGDRVIFDSTNIEYLNNKRSSAVISGVFCGVVSRKVDNMHQLMDLKITCKVQRNTEDQVMNLYTSPFLTGTVVSLTVDMNNILDVRAFLTDIRSVSKKEMEGYIKENKVLETVKAGANACYDDGDGDPSDAPNNNLDQALSKAMSHILH